MKKIMSLEEYTPHPYDVVCRFDTPEHAQQIASLLYAAESWGAHLEHLVVDVYGLAEDYDIYCLHDISQEPPGDVVQYMSRRFPITWKDRIIYSDGNGALDIVLAYTWATDELY